jgi:hypothetical protein
MVQLAGKGVLIVIISPALAGLGNREVALVLRVYPSKDDDPPPLPPIKRP